MRCESRSTSGRAVAETRVSANVGRVHFCAVEKVLESNNVALLGGFGDLVLGFVTPRAVFSESILLV